LQAETTGVGRALALALLALTLGHVFSNAVRTIPAVAADVLMRDLGLSAEALGAVTSAYPFAFAAVMLPVGVALDRWGVKRTALGLLAVGGTGALMGALAQGPTGMLVAQIVLGIGCSGMLMAPTTAQRMGAREFGLWSGIILALGNCGMLLSASPLALLVEWQGWRAGYLASAAMAFAAIIAVAITVAPDAPAGRGQRSLRTDLAEVWAIATAPALRPVLVFGFASMAASLGLRGLWGGPWLMEEKGLNRVEAGNVLLLMTLAMVAGPALAGWAMHRTGRAALLLVASHLTVAGILLLILAGGPGAPLSAALGVPMLPPAWDAALFTAFGLILSFQVLAFSLVRGAVPPSQTGRALSANNISFFGGAAVLQAVSGVAAAWGGVPAAILTFAVALVVCTAGFLWLRRGTM
jgi:predicted MFS family arabinose efflux permease